MALAPWTAPRAPCLLGLEPESSFEVGVWLVRFLLGEMREGRVPPVLPPAGSAGGQLQPGFWRLTHELGGLQDILLRNGARRAENWVPAACAALQLGTLLGFAYCQSCQCFLLYSWHQVGILSELVLPNVDERAKIHY